MSPIFHKVSLMRKFLQLRLLHAPYQSMEFSECMSSYAPGKRFNCGKILDMFPNQPTFPSTSKLELTMQWVSTTLATGGNVLKCIANWEIESLFIIWMNMMTTNTQVSHSCISKRDKSFGLAQIWWLF